MHPKRGMISMTGLTLEPDRLIIQAADEGGGPTSLLFERAEGGA